MKAKFTAIFLMINMGPISFYLDLKLEQNQTNQMIKLLQPAYIDKILSTFHLNQAHTVNTLINKTTLF